MSYIILGIGALVLLTADAADRWFPGWRMGVAWGVLLALVVICHIAETIQEGRTDRARIARDAARKERES